LLDLFRKALEKLSKHLLGKNFSSEIKNTVYTLLKENNKSKQQVNTISEEEIKKIAEERWSSETNDKGYPLRALSEVEEEVREELKNKQQIIKSKESEKTILNKTVEKDNTDLVLNNDSESLVPIQNNLKSYKSFDEKTKEIILDKFKKGEKLLITPANKRVKNISVKDSSGNIKTIENPERLFVENIVKYMEEKNNIKITKGNISKYIVFTPIDENTTLINKKSLFGSGFTQTSEELFSILELPLIKTKC
jgi:hypothetical protein